MATVTARRSLREHPPGRPAISELRSAQLALQRGSIREHERALPRTRGERSRSVLPNPVVRLTLAQTLRRPANELGLATGECAQQPLSPAALKPVTVREQAQLSGLLGKRFRPQPGRVDAVQPCRVSDVAERVTSDGEIEVDQRVREVVVAKDHVVRPSAAFLK
jgi:hypothetical protein